jgi:hypothetical protein
MPDLLLPLSHVSYGADIHDMFGLRTGCISLAGSYYWSPDRFVWGWRANVIYRMLLRRALRSANVDRVMSWLPSLSHHPADPESKLWVIEDRQQRCVDLWTCHFLR